MGYVGIAKESVPMGTHVCPFRANMAAGFPSYCTCNTSASHDDGESQLLAWVGPPDPIAATPLSFGVGLPMSAPNVLTEGFGPYCMCNTRIPLPAQEAGSLPSGVLPGGWLLAMWPAQVVKVACPACAFR